MNIVHQNVEIGKRERFIQASMQTHTGVIAIIFVFTAGLVSAYCVLSAAGYNRL